MEAREQTVAAAYHATYEWMLGSEQYSAWKGVPGQRLLIKGKAVSGKPTLMKHLLKNEISANRSGSARNVVCGFFFNGRGGLMEKTLKGMLRTILHQVILQRPTAYKFVAQFHQDMKDANASREQSTVEWTGESLTQMFEIVMQSCSSPTLIFIDGLDEGEGFSPAEMFALLETLTGTRPDGHHPLVSVCLSSRPDNFVNHRKKWTTMDLADFNGVDIEMYTANRLHTIAKDCADYRYEQLATELVPQIVRQADGVFLWVRLVVDEISAAMERGESRRYIEAQLSATPADLWDNFERMLLQVKDHHVSDMKRVLGIVLAAERPLTVEELAHVLPLSSSHPPRMLRDIWDTRTADRACYDMRKRIQLCCGGLVEVLETSRSFAVYEPDRLGYRLTSQVQFIHQSVKDYLKAHQMEADSGVLRGPPLLEQSGHQLLLAACLRYYLQLPELEAVASADWPKLPHTVDERDKFWAGCETFWANTTGQYPFLMYSPNWIKHADRFIATGHEAEFSHKFSRQYPKLALSHPEEMETASRSYAMERVFRVWRFFPCGGNLKNDNGYTWIEGLYTHVYQNMTKTSDETFKSLLVFSAYQGFVFLFNSIFGVLQSFMSSKAFSLPLIAACDCWLEGKNSGIGGVGSRYRRDLESEERGFGLPETTWQAKETILSTLLEGGADVNVIETAGRFASPLMAACWSGRLSMVEMLLDAGADMNAEVGGGRYGSALVASVWGSSTAVVELLIQRGANVNAQVRGGYIGSALAEAAISGNREMVQTLIDGGADVNLVLWYGASDPRSPPLRNMGKC